MFDFRLRDYYPLGFPFPRDSSNQTFFDSSPALKISAGSHRLTTPAHLLCHRFHLARSAMTK